MRKLILTPFDKATRAYVRLENGGPIQNQISRHSRVFESGRPIFDRFLQISIDSRDEYHGNERFSLSLSLSWNFAFFPTLFSSICFEVACNMDLSLSLSLSLSMARLSSSEFIVEIASGSGTRKWNCNYKTGYPRWGTKGKWIMENCG